MIAVNCRFLEKETGGIGRYAIALVRALRASRTDVQCVASHAVAPQFESIAHELGVRRIGPFSSILWEQTTLPAYLAAHGRPLLLNLVNTAPLAYERQVSVIYDLSYLRYPDAFTSTFVRVYSALVPRGARRSRIVVTLSDFTRCEIVETFDLAADHVRVVPGFVTPALAELARAHGAHPSDAFGDYMLTVSSFSARKNLRGAMLAFRRAAPPGLRLIVVGQGLDVFRAVGFDDLIGSDVVLAGAVSDDELVRLYAGARALIYPSLYEGFGLPPLEAMMCGCPVIASKATSLPEVCGDAARYCDASDLDALSAAIAELARDDALCQSLRERGYARAQHFSVAASLGALESALSAADAGRAS